MPLYEFICDRCKIDIEVLSPVRYKICNKCETPMRRKFSTFAFKVVGGTSRNLVKELYKDELDTTMDDYQTQKKNNLEKIL